MYVKFVSNQFIWPSSNEFYNCVLIAPDHKMSNIKVIAYIYFWGDKNVIGVTRIPEVPGALGAAQGVNLKFHLIKKILNKSYLVCFSHEKYSLQRSPEGAMYVIQ